MPYIHPDDYAGAASQPETPGELNYAITMLLLRYLDRQQTRTYAKFADCIGALECAKAEFYRRVIVPYEEKKIKSTGDVY
jgi:hypothetical protein